MNINVVMLDNGAFMIFDLISENKEEKYYEVENLCFLQTGIDHEKKAFGFQLIPTPMIEEKSKIYIDKILAISGNVKGNVASEFQEKFGKLFIPKPNVSNINSLIKKNK